MPNGNDHDNTGKKRRENTGTENDIKRKALIISVSEYDNKLQSLPFCKNDGQKMYELLKSIGYEIPDRFKLIGRVNHETMKKAIQDFFMKEVKSKDTLLLYFSGHGIPEDNGVHYLATSEIDPEEPYDKGYPFEDLERMMDRSISKRKVIMLDCCYSGAARPGDKGGNEEEAASLGREAINNTIKAGEGKCVLASSLSYQKSFASKEQEHSIFTYYLMDGLQENKESVNSDGTITPDTLGRYVYDKVTEKLPKQKPIRKVEASGDIILAQYPKLARKPSVDISSIIYEGQQYIKLQDYDNALSSFDKAISINPNSYIAYNDKGDVLSELAKYEEAINAFDKSIIINPKDPVTYNHKGDVLFKISKYKEAIDCYDEALKINPRYFDVLKDKGLALSNLGIYDEAIESYDKALEIIRSPQIWYYKGLALQKVYRKKDAISCYDQALKINPKYYEAREAKDDLEDSKKSYFSKLREDEWDRLLRSIENKEVIPFIGPETYDPWIPHPVKRAKTWAEEFSYPLEDSHVLAKVAQYLAILREDNRFPKQLLSEELRKIITPDFSLDQNKDTPYAVLAELPFPVYITTNYDYFMEEALKKKNRNPVSEFCRWNHVLTKMADNMGREDISVKRSSYTPSPAEPLVYHLHGIFDMPESMVLTERDCMTFINNLNRDRQEIISPVLLRCMARSSLLSIGFSIYNMSPIDFRTTMNSLVRSMLTSILIMQPLLHSNSDRLDQTNEYIIKYAKKMYNLRAYSYNIDEFSKELRDRWRGQQVLL